MLPMEDLATFGGAGGSWVGVGVGAGVGVGFGPGAVGAVGAVGLGTVVAPGFGVALPPRGSPRTAGRVVSSGCVGAAADGAFSPAAGAAGAAFGSASAGAVLAAAPGVSFDGFFTLSATSKPPPATSPSTVRSFQNDVPPPDVVAGALAGSEPVGAAW